MGVKAMFKASYKDILTFAKSKGWEFSPLHKFKDAGLKKKVLGLHHHVKCMTHANMIAPIENGLGVKATYFFSHTEDYYVNMEHHMEFIGMCEIGLLLDFPAIIQAGDIPHHFLQREVARFKKAGITIEGISFNDAGGLKYFKEFSEKPVRVVVNNKDNTFCGMYGIHSMKEYGFKYVANKINAVSFISDEFGSMGHFKIAWDASDINNFQVSTSLEDFFTKSKMKTMMNINPFWWV